MPFYAVYDRIAPAANKYMATLFNTSSTRKVTVDRVYCLNWQVTAVVGVLLEQELRYVTARTIGSAVTIQREDTTETLSSGIEADVGSTTVTEGTGDRGLIRRIIASSEEIALATAYGLNGVLANITDAQLKYYRHPGSLGLVLRQNQGVTVKNITSSTIGTVSYIFEFRDELA